MCPESRTISILTPMPDSRPGWMPSTRPILAKSDHRIVAFSTQKFNMPKSMKKLILMNTIIAIGKMLISNLLFSISPLYPIPESSNAPKLHRGMSPNTPTARRKPNSISERNKPYPGRFRKCHRIRLNSKVTLQIFLVTINAPIATE